MTARRAAKDALGVPLAAGSLVFAARDPQNLCPDSPYASYPLDLTATLQRLLRQSAGKVIHCPIMGPFPGTPLEQKSALCRDASGRGPAPSDG
jgi:hypothetical protein